MEKVKVGLRAVDQKLDTLKELVLSLAFRDGSSNNDNNVARTTVAGGAPTLQLAAAWGGHPGGNGRLAPGLGGGGFEVAGGGWVAGGDAYPVHYLQQQQQGQHVQQQVGELYDLSNACLVCLRSLKRWITLPKLFHKFTTEHPKIRKHPTTKENTLCENRAITLSATLKVVPLRYDGARTIRSILRKSVSSVVAS